MTLEVRAAAADKIERRVDNTPSGLRQLHDCINLKEIRFGAFSFSASFLKISCRYLVTSYLKFEMFFTIFKQFWTTIVFVIKFKP